MLSIVVVRHPVSELARCLLELVSKFVQSVVQPVSASARIVPFLVEVGPVAHLCSALQVQPSRQRTEIVYNKNLHAGCTPTKDVFNSNSARTETKIDGEMLAR